MKIPLISKDTPLEAAQAKLIAVRANLSKRTAELRRLEEERPDSLVTDQPIHLADVQRLAQDVRQLEDVAAAWADEVAQLEEAERKANRKFESRCGPRGYWYVRDLINNVDLLGKEFATRDEAQAWIDISDEAVEQLRVVPREFGPAITLGIDGIMRRVGGDEPPDGGFDEEFDKWRDPPLTDGATP
jgi:multidrug efflux pump subunit AcrA (membrane-fusion protein)